MRDKEAPPLLGLPLDVWLPAFFPQLLFLQTRVLPQDYLDMLGGNLILPGELEQTLGQVTRALTANSRAQTWATAASTNRLAWLIFTRWSQTLKKHPGNNQETHLIRDEFPR